jgi:hypothetical protein
MVKTRYDWNRLKSFCEENEINLIKDYSKENINRGSAIYGICKTPECNCNFDKKFGSLIKNNNPYCKDCSIIEKTKKTKATNMKNHGVEFISQVPGVREKAENTMLDRHGVKYATQSKVLLEKMVKNNQEKYGVDNVSQIPEVREKVENTMIEIYGVKNALQNSVLKKKAENTMLERYGTKISFQVEEFKEKAKKTNLERYDKTSYFATDECKEITKQKCLDEYGVDHYSKAPVIKQKVENTNLQKFGKKSYLATDECKEITKQKCLDEYGVDHYSKALVIKQKIEDTMVSKFGVKSVFQIPEVRDKMNIVMIEQKDEIVEKRKQTSLHNWGTEHPMQNAYLAEKASKNAYKLKEYTFPSGRIVKVQGDEPFALDELIYIENINENDIIISRSNVPEIWYEDEDGIKHRHFVDIYVKSQNRCIEAKSTWTAKMKKDCIFLKQQAGKELGFNYEIWVYDKKGEKVECYK